MNRINTLFQKKTKNIFSVFITAGYPTKDSTISQIKSLAANGVDMIEIGMPFSDPLADGPVIQQSSQIALQNGMSIKVLFEQLQDIRKEVSIPLVLMGYLNPVMQYGIENFCKKASELGIDGIILPDLPIAEYEQYYQNMFDKYNLRNIFLITPQTSEERIIKIDVISNGFLYIVSTSSTTGIKGRIASEQESYFNRLKAMNLRNPSLIGFGISNRESFQKACNYANGAIIGSAYIKAVSDSNNINESIKSFVSGIL